MQNKMFSLPHKIRYFSTGKILSFKVSMLLPEGEPPSNPSEHTPKMHTQEFLCLKTFPGSDIQQACHQSPVPITKHTSGVMKKLIQQNG